MITDPNRVAREQIAPMFGMEPKADFVDTFEENKAEYPQLFQDPGECWQNEMSTSDLELFWKCHGDVMKLLGYGQEAADVSS
jgi:hypothetical protein